MLSRAVVVVPAHDEEAELPACLESLQTAVAQAPLPTQILLVLDACTDGSARIARAAGVPTLAVDARNVGRARRAGMAAALAGADPATLWLACTDADTRVTPDWLGGQLRHAARGADLVVGTIEVHDWTGWPPGAAEAFGARYGHGIHGARHSHVHGANLGVRGSAYLRAGGFPALGTGEDHGLVQAAVAQGLCVVRATDIPVVTSARPVARATGGFSDDLRAQFG